MTAEQKKKIVGILLALAAAVASALYGSSFLQTAQDSSIPSGVQGDDLMTVTFVDVGQGDCQYVTFPDGSCMLIDSGEAQYANKVAQKLKNDGCTRIDTLVITHPHTDHMGGMTQLLSDFDVGEIYMPRQTTDTAAYYALLESIDEKGMTIHTATAGETISFSEEITGMFLAPVSGEYEELNNASAVLKLTYDDISFLFTGDAETLSEEEMLEKEAAWLDSDVLKVGHHGSSGSSSAEFLAAVSPEYAVISCGTDNRYGHPHNETLARLADCGAAVYRTDINGDIAFTTDGVALEMEA